MDAAFPAELKPLGSQHHAFHARCAFSCGVLSFLVIFEHLGAVMKICIITTVLAVGFAVVANADQAANGCAAGLSSDGPMICSNTAGMDGTLFRDAARRAAEAAGQFPEP